MNQINEHFPLPWKEDELERGIIRDAEGVYIGKILKWQNRDFAILSANNFYKMREITQKLKLRLYEYWSMQGVLKKPNVGYNDETVELIGKAEALLKEVDHDAQ